MLENRAKVKVFSHSTHSPVFNQRNQVLQLNSISTYVEQYVFFIYLAPFNLIFISSSMLNTLNFAQRLTTYPGLGTPTAAISSSYRRFRPANKML